MIKASELRVGNWVQVLGVYKYSFERGGLITVDAELIYLVQQLEIGVIGIPLTPEILVKCGFKKRVYDTPEQQDVYGHVDVYELEEGFILTPHDGGFSLNDHSITKCQTFHYLHQIQTLYFALTGEELTINL